MQTTAENYALIAPVDWKEPDQLAASTGAHHTATTTLHVGKSRKAVHIPTSMLMDKSPYFRRILTEDSGKAGDVVSAESTTFDDLDEFGMGLFMHWLQTHGKLGGPHDFHSLAHYLSLYVLAKKFEVESLENQSMFICDAWRWPR
jgi:hypothetical protein